MMISMIGYFQYWEADLFLAHVLIGRFEKGIL